MRIVFWQHIISMIDLPYIVGVAKDPRVSEVVVIGNEILKERKEMGWDANIPGIENCKVYTNVSENQMQEILKDNPDKSFHVFTGLNVYKHVHKAFLASLNYPVHRAFISERPLTYALGYDWLKPLWLHKLRFLLRNKKYMKYIDCVFEIGKESSNYYEYITNKWKVYPFCYCTRHSASQGTTQLNSPKVNIIYVGSLCLRKSVKTILEANKLLIERGMGAHLSISIIGDGKKRKNLEGYVLKNNIPNVSFYGNLPNIKVLDILKNNDILILPSIHDGWGAVINEALQLGLYVFCSDRCGAKELIKDDTIGKVFKVGDSYQLSLYIEEAISSINKIRNNNYQRMRWANDTIDGLVVGKYIIDCLLGLECHAPWQKNI